MGRLPPLIGLTCLIATMTASCDGQKPKVTVTNERSQAILGSPSAAVSVPASAVVEATAPMRPKRPRILCGGRLGKAGPELPSDQPTRRSASGERDLPEQVHTRGHYTWINFWAAWCGPCKEEIPRLLAWEKKLSDVGVALKVVFVSLDDDERQLTTFLDKQPNTGLRRTYWLEDGAKRTDWLKAVGVNPTVNCPYNCCSIRAVTFVVPSTAQSTRLTTINCVDCSMARASRGAQDRSVHSISTGDPSRLKLPVFLEPELAAGHPGCTATTSRRNLKQSLAVGFVRKPAAPRYGRFGTVSPR